MISDIVSSIFWGVLFFATFPWMLIFAGGAAHPHHISGRGGYIRDFYVNISPIMPGAVALYFGGVHGGNWALWIVLVAIMAAGAALFWAPPVRNARARLKAATRTAQASWSSNSDQ